MPASCISRRRCAAMRSLRIKRMAPHGPSRPAAVGILPVSRLAHHTCRSRQKARQGSSAPRPRAPPARYVKSADERTRAVSANVRPLFSLVRWDGRRHGRGVVPPPAFCVTSTRVCQRLLPAHPVPGQNQGDRPDRSSGRYCSPRAIELLPVGDSAVSTTLSRTLEASTFICRAESTRADFEV